MLLCNHFHRSRNKLRKMNLFQFELSLCTCSHTHSASRVDNPKRGSLKKYSPQDPSTVVYSSYEEFPDEIPRNFDFVWEISFESPTFVRFQENYFQITAIPANFYLQGDTAPKSSYMQTNRMNFAEFNSQFSDAHKRHNRISCITLDKSLELTIRRREK